MPPLLLRTEMRLCCNRRGQGTYNGIAAEGRVRAVFLYEDDEVQIGRNYLARDGRAQPERARISLLVSTWLRAEAERLGLPARPARPWETVLARVIAALNHHGMRYRRHPPPGQSR